MHGESGGWIPVLLIAIAIGAGAGGCQMQPAASVAPRAPAPVARPAGATVAPAVERPATAPAAAMLGADLGAAGGWLIAATPQRLAGNSADAARQASERAEQHPANPADAQAAPTADLNNDGFVTLDEVLAMRRAGLDDATMIRRLQATGQVFTITDRQQQYLRDRAVDQQVIDAMKSMHANGTAAASTH